MDHLVPLSGQNLSLINLRKGETKLGETMLINGRDPKPGKGKAGFAVIGIKEDIGPRANFGKPGADKMWECFLGKFLNLQSNQFLTGSTIWLAGSIDCSEEMKLAEGTPTIERLRELTSQIDKKVAETIREIMEIGMIPVVIGGGHNNAYGIIKGVSEAKKRSIGVINIDPHADFRPIEGRHSGNGFSYAFEAGFLSTYFVLGLHEAYNSAYIIDHFNSNPALAYSSFDHLLRGETTLEIQIERALEHMDKTPFGLELDLDSIAGFPSSAETESGYTVNEARKIIMALSKETNPLYAHFPEGSPDHGTDSAALHGKTLAYLVSDFIKSNTK
ncbi:MAG TPA: formimidoylglutamase [Flavobacteriales bacterium]|nr:formimidoylglutamase [Flavobacteriales bacterium]